MSYSFKSSVEAIKSARSKAAKKIELERLLMDETCSLMVKYTLDPYITFGVSKATVKDITDEVDGGTGDGVSDSFDFSDDTWEMLDKLKDRELTGNEALKQIRQEYSYLNEEGAYALKTILSKTLNAGCGATLVNSVQKGLIPKFDCMLAHKFEPHRIDQWPQLIEPKYDGVRVLALIDLDKQEVRFTSREGNDFTTFDHLTADALLVAKTLTETRPELSDKTKFVLDGEVMSGQFNKTVGDVRRKDFAATDARFYLFSWLTLADFEEGKTKLTLLDIRNVLEDAINLLPSDENMFYLTPRYLVSSTSEIMAFYAKFRDMGLEGAIVKNPKKPYTCRRNHAWMKIKANESVDVTVIDCVEGTGKNVGKLGALVVALDNGVECNVGSGLSDEQRESFWDNTDEVIGRTVEVSYHEVTPDGSLRHPVFQRFRDDKAA